MRGIVLYKVCLQPPLKCLLDQKYITATLNPDSAQPLSLSKASMFWNEQVLEWQPCQFLYGLVLTSMTIVLPKL